MIDNLIIVHRLRLILLMTATTLFLSGTVSATIVRFDTVMGHIDVRLFETATPLYTANLLDYINADRYDGSFMHRSVPGFIIQGGGFYFDPNSATIFNIPVNPAVNNEPGISNIRGTFSMAKNGGNPNSATSQWFPNISHNTNNLDNQNGGFTVFGSILGDGIGVFDSIATLPIIDLFPGDPNDPFDPDHNDPFNTLPIRNVPGGLAENLVVTNDVYVLDLFDGDYTFDGSVDAADLAKWESDYGRLKLIGGDFNDDREMDSADLSIWEGNYGTVSGSVSYDDGDSNGDKFVDGFDFLNWQRGAGYTVDVAADGDGDAQITGLEFLQWQQNYGSSLPLSSVNSVPEPAALTLLLVGVVALRRQRRS